MHENSLKFINKNKFYKKNYKKELPKKNLHRLDSSFSWNDDGRN